MSIKYLSTSFLSAAKLWQLLQWMIYWEKIVSIHMHAYFYAYISTYISKYICKHNIYMIILSFTYCVWKNLAFVKRWRIIEVFESLYGGCWLPPVGNTAPGSMGNPGRSRRPQECGVGGTVLAGHVPHSALGSHRWGRRCRAKMGAAGPHGGAGWGACWTVVLSICPLYVNHHLRPPQRGG